MTLIRKIKNYFLNKIITLSFVEFISAPLLTKKIADFSSLAFAQTLIIDSLFFKHSSIGHPFSMS
jgi:flagellar biosynthesis protein FliQ